jgi:hypothetical protein
MCHQSVIERLYLCFQRLNKLMRERDTVLVLRERGRVCCESERVGVSPLLDELVWYVHLLFVEEEY